MLNPRFDPMLQPHWTLPMSVAWIAYRNPEAVQMQLNAYRTDRCGLPEADLASLFIEETAEDHLPASKVMSCLDAKQLLWLALQAGDLTSRGLCGAAASHSMIDPVAWLRLEAEELADAVRTPEAEVAKGAQVLRFTDVRIAREDVVRLWPPVEQDGSTTVEGETFHKSRWPLSATLAWIMSRDSKFVNAARCNGKQVQSLDIQRSIAEAGCAVGLSTSPQFTFKSAHDAFINALAPALAAGKIKGVGFRRFKSKLSGTRQSVPDVFPPPDMPPEAALVYELGDEPGGSLEPIGSRLSHERWIFTDLTFGRSEVLALWPAVDQTRNTKAARKLQQKRGPKGKYPWTQIRGVVFDRFEEEGSPPAADCTKGWRKKADLELLIQEKCAEMIGEECSRSTAGEKAAEWIAEWETHHRSETASNSGA